MVYAFAFTLISRPSARFFVLYYEVSPKNLPPLAVYTDSVGWPPNLCEVNK